MPHGQIKGQVYDAETLRPLPYTNVYLEGANRGAATNGEGAFVIHPVKPGRYRLLAERIGYRSYVVNDLKVAADETLTVSIPLLATEIEADEVVVTAARREQTAQMAPASVAVVNSRAIRERAVKTFDQVLEMVPGVSVYRSAGVTVQSLSIRGSSDVAGGGVGNRVLLTIDGRPALTADTGGALWSLVPTSFVDQVEVVKGAFSSLYGSAAMGGVINVITRRPTYRASTTINLGYGFVEQPPRAFRFTEGNLLQSQLEFSHSGKRGRLSYLFDVSRKETDGHRENSGYRFYNLFAKVLYNVKDTRNFEISLGSTVSDNDFPHTWLSRLQPLRVAERFHDDRQEKRTYSLDVNYWAIANAQVKYSSRFFFYRNAARSFYNENDHNWQVTGNQPLGLKTIVDADKFGNITQVDWALSQDNYLIAGLDVQLDHVDSSPDTIMYGNHQVNNAALYAQDEINLSSKLTATLGLRYDWNHLIGGITLGQLSPKIAAVYRPNAAIALRLLAGQAFRAPSIAERFFQQELNGGTLFKPNPQLKAERLSFSVETGARIRLSDLMEFDLAVFRYHYRDMIFWEEISDEEGVVYTLFQVRNLNRALLQGVETSLRIHWGEKLRASVNYTYTDAKDQSANRVDDTLPYRVRHAVFLSLGSTLGRFSFGLTGRYQSRIEEVFLYPFDAPEAFFVANAKATITMNQHLRLTASVNNLTNTEYEELARYRMPGRNWMFGMRYQF